MGEIGRCQTIAKHNINANCVRSSWNVHYGHATMECSQVSVMSLWLRCYLNNSDSHYQLFIRTSTAHLPFWDITPPIGCQIFSPRQLPSVFQHQNPRLEFIMQGTPKFTRNFRLWIYFGKFNFNLKGITFKIIASDKMQSSPVFFSYRDVVGDCRNRNRTMAWWCVLT